MTTSINGKKARVRLALVVTAAIVCSSATLSGAIATLAAQQPAFQSMA